MEDGVVIAVCLARAQRNNHIDVPLALRVFERIRFNRSHITHLSSVSNRDGYHNADFDSDEILRHPEILNLPRFRWVLEFDAERDAESHFDHLAADVRNGRKGTIEELSVPAGGTFDISERIYSNAVDDAEEEDQQSSLRAHL
jgi:hypothetical protein